MWDMGRAWVIRSGRAGEREDWAIENGLSGAGWTDVPDLSACLTRDEVSDLVDASYTGTSAGYRQNATAQLWALRHRIQVGDLVVMPLKKSPLIAFGRVTAGYQYADDSDPSKRHVVSVRWDRTDVPRTAVKQDLLYTLGSALTVFAPSKNDAVERLKEINRSGRDPGQISSPLPVASELRATPHDEVDDPETQTDIETVSRDRIQRRVEEDFAGHDLADLVAALLTADGFVCRVAGPGADGGVDIVAGRGLLGMDSPRLIVQVKSGSQVSEPVVRDLSGVVHSRNADQGLLVAWGGLTRAARAEVERQAFHLRAWTADDVIENLQREYDRLDEEIRARIPLKRVWMLAEET